MTCLRRSSSGKRRLWETGDERCIVRIPGGWLVPAKTVNTRAPGWHIPCFKLVFSSENKLGKIVSRIDERCRIQASAFGGCLYRVFTGRRIGAGANAFRNVA